MPLKNGKITMRTRADSLESIHTYCVDTKKRIIYIHAEIDTEQSESFVDFKMATRAIKNLDYLESISVDPILLKLISCGGSWDYGMAIYDRIKSSKCHVTCESYSFAASMSSIIPQAADKRLIHQNCAFMAHYGTTSHEGDFRSVKHSVDYYNTTNQTMLKIYADRCVNSPYAKEKGLTVSQVEKFIKSKIEKLTDWWMPPQDAVYYGFMDEVI
jgi:ATP-dependent protease ClpP protease subunit